MNGILKPLLAPITAGVVAVLLNAGCYVQGAAAAFETPAVTGTAPVSPAGRSLAGVKLAWKPGSKGATNYGHLVDEVFGDQWPDKIYAGKMDFLAREIASTPVGFTFRPKNSYANVAFKATRVSSLPNNEKLNDADTTKRTLEARSFRIDKLPKMTGENQEMSLWAGITDVKEDGAAFTAVFVFAGEDVTCKVERTEYKVTINPVPDIREMRYGPHFRQTIDFYKAKSDKPTPLLLSIHGGGWTGGNKSKMLPPVNALLSQGISVASISYRYVYDGVTDKVHPAIAAPLLDAARALQFLRSKAAELNIDKERIAAQGVSAGGFSSLWLAFHEDMADPDSNDPVARESTRLFCVVGLAAPLSLDPKLMAEWDVIWPYHVFFDLEESHKSKELELQAWLAHRDEWLAKGWIQEYSPYSHVARNSPPVCLDYRWQSLTENGGHSPRSGIHLKKRMDELGVECHLNYDGVKDAEYPEPLNFLIKKLKESKP